MNNNANHSGSNWQGHAPRTRFEAFGYGGSDLLRSTRHETLTHKIAVFIFCACMAVAFMGVMFLHATR